MADESNRAYLDGLKMLARRELSEMQVRTRLARRQHQQHHIDDAIARLRDERAINDTRAARAIARAAASLRGLGKRRARMQVDAAGIERAIASAAVDEVFAEIDSHELLQTALAKRLRGRTRIEDDAEKRRLFRHLVGRGFDEDRVIAALRALLERIS